MSHDRTRPTWAAQFHTTAILSPTDGVPAFFVPGVPIAEQETRYADFASACGCSILPAGERIYAVEWLHNGVRWTGVVGHSLTGTRHIKASRQKPARIEQHSDAAIVCAIFPGWVVTNGAYGSQWSNPLRTGIPITVTLFGTAPPPKEDSRVNSADP